MTSQSDLFARIARNYTNLLVTWTGRKYQEMLFKVCNDVQLELNLQRDASFTVTLFKSASSFAWLFPSVDLISINSIKLFKYLTFDICVIFRNYNLEQSI